MTRLQKFAFACVGIGAVALIAWPVYAHCGRCMTSARDMVKMMDADKLTLPAAITAAEKHTNGKALAAYTDYDDGTLSIDVYCLAGDKIMQVEVDRMGKATKAEEVKMLPAHEEMEHGESHGD